MIYEIIHFLDFPNEKSKHVRSSKETCPKKVKAKVKVRRDNLGLDKGSHII